MANLWIVPQLEMQPTVLLVQRIWTSFCVPSVGAQQLGEVTWKLGFFLGGGGWWSGGISSAQGLAAIM